MVLEEKRQEDFSNPMENSKAHEEKEYVKKSL
jgi:hypothetical protein